ncbi:MAG: hypothetical protein M3Q45_11335 [Chloroflexota bacterium]|nr:hypothetical protein [Chloroflexota bacterium]
MTSDQTQSLAQFLTNLAGQLPLLIVYCVGLSLAWQRRTQQPSAARLTAIALGIQLMETVAMTWLIAWFPQAAVDNGMSGSEIQTAFVWIGVVRTLIAAGAVGLLLVAIFGGQPQPKLRRGLHPVFGFMLGAVVGIVIALLLGDAIGAALDISTMEGGRGYFTVFLFAPLLAVVGGVISAVWLGRRRQVGARNQ